ncbi:hypothetical protein LAV39_02080 [Bacillus pumilus]|uniref:hypothetical protein n=1 Tax=Bacillus pumilus TaxID=1408 RepID=UPI002B2442C6|nr:hypothetical protein [Bacillus pumilus]MEB2356478.1 hypothetical protein [Bacillus pumilus]
MAYRSDDYILLTTYYELLFTIEESLKYLDEIEKDFAKTEGDRIFNDLIHAFFHLETTHPLLLSIIENEHFAKTIRSFDQIFLSFDILTFYTFPSIHFQSFLTSYFIPEYRKWMDEIHACMRPYVIH